MYFSGFMARFLMLRVFAKEYVGDRSKSASESVVAVSEPMKRYVSNWWRAALQVQAKPPNTLLHGP